MVSVVPGGTAVRIAARTLFNVLRAGSGTPARYSSTFFGAPLPFGEERRSCNFTFFMRAMLQELPCQVYAPCVLQRAPYDRSAGFGVAIVRVALRLPLLLFFGLFDGPAKFLNRGHVR